jgi:hypothetical protein
MNGMVTAGRVIGFLALVAVAGAGCGTSGSSTPKVSVAAAAARPCLLISPSEATAVLGQRAIPDNTPGGNVPACGFNFDVNPTITYIGFSIVPAPFAQVAPYYIGGSPAPASGVGYGAVCGPSSPFSNTSVLVGPVDSGHSLHVAGIFASCATVEKFATILYSHLRV